MQRAERATRGAHARRRDASRRTIDARIRLQLPLATLVTDMVTAVPTAVGAAVTIPAVTVVTMAGE